MDPRLFAAWAQIDDRLRRAISARDSVSIKDTKGKRMTLVADADTVVDLSLLKAGDEVKVTYKKEKHQLVGPRSTWPTGRRR